MRFAISFILIACGTAAAQLPDPFADPSDAKRFADIATVETSITPKAAKPGAVVTLSLTVTLKPTCHTYPVSFLGKGQIGKNTIVTPAGGPLIAVEAVEDPQKKYQTKPGEKPGETEIYYVDVVTWEWQAVVSPLAKAGPYALNFDKSRLLACNEHNCFTSNKSDIPVVAFEVLAGPAVSVPVNYQLAVDKALGGETPVAPPPPAPVEEKQGLKRKDAKPLAEYQADLDAVAASLVKSEASATTVSSSGLLGLLTAAIFWGYISLITPCVFPMIPITVSLFLKQSHHSTAGAVKYALVYCLTIVVVLGLAAVFLLGVFRELSVSPGMNLFLGLLLFVFALSLFGMYDIQLPGFLLRATEKRRAGGGMIGTIFGALAFSIVSFTCVAPFLGGFAGLAASGNYSRTELVLAGLTFAAAFASPFFVLALFPSLLKKLPRSGGWLDTVKAVMGFLELAAAFKFFRTAELRRPPVEYFTYDVVLGAWVVISLVCGLYLLGLFRLPHDDEKPNLPVPRLLFALLFLGFGCYLMPGLYKTADGRPQRPSGVAFAWVEAFLLPEPVEDLPWSADLKGTLESARASKKLVFVDFTGVTCTNCKYNETTIFPVASINESLRKYSLVQMYTDDVPAEFYRNPPPLAERKDEGSANLAFQDKCFGTQQLPLYVILQPLADGSVRVVNIYDEGKINNREAFAAFLAKPLKK